VGSRTVRAVLSFDGEGRLVDFVSDDRMVAGRDGELTSMRWSTPVEEYRDFGGVTATVGGRGLWHPEGAEPWAYFEGRLVELEVG
jgi:hypothetical protein